MKINNILKKSVYYFLVSSILLMLHTSRAQTFIAKEGINTGNSTCSGWKTQDVNGDWSNNMGLGNLPGTAPNYWQPGASNSNLVRGHTLLPTNLVWGGTGRMTHYKIEFERKKSDCKKVYIQIGGDDQFSVRLNGGGWLTQSHIGSGGQIFYKDITKDVKCGTNEIYVAVENTNAGPNYFIGILEFGPEKSELSSNSITHTAIECGKNVVLNAPTILGLDNVKYEWYNPLGVLIGQYPFLSLTYPKPSQNGIYKVKISSECCEYELSINLVFPDCDKCDAELITVRNSCYELEARVKSKYVNIKCFQFQLNGVNVYANENNIAKMNLKPGNNKVCVLYWGNVFSNPNKFCCNEICTNIYVPIPDTLTEEISFCNMPEMGSTYATFDPCSKSPIGGVRFTHENNSAQYAVMMEGFCPSSSSLTLLEGNHTFKYYDINGCLLRILKVKVIKKEPEVSYCHKIIYDSCNQATDPNSVTPSMFAADLQCNSCYFTSLNNPNTGFASMMWYNGRPVYVRAYFDVLNCKICYFTYEIIKVTCNIIADFDIVFNPLTNEYTLTNLSSGTGTPLFGKWNIKRDDNGMFKQINVNPQNPNFLSTNDPLFGPGNYTICFSVQYFYCGIECFKEICKKIVVNLDGSITILPNEVPPPIQDNMDDFKDKLLEFVKNNKNTKIESSNKELNENKLPVKNTIFKSLTLKIIPNPTASVFKVQPTDGTIINYDKIEVIDLNGKIIFKQNNINSNTEVDLSNKSDNIYIIKIYKENQIQQLKLVKTQN